MFRSKQELSTPCIIEKPHMVSIWSEDIIAAKNLAMFLNRDITFINAHMEFCTGVLISRKIISLSMLDGYINICKESINTIDPKIRTGSIHDFFYDGKLQKPVKDTYWMYNGNVWANATKEDVKRCTNSAKQGFQIWSTRSTSSRIEVLSNFAHTLECNGQFVLAKTVSKCLKLPGIHDNVLVCYQDERLEVSDIRTPKGVILLQHKNIIKLFSYLTLSLVVGNSVVVICDENSCTLAPYCNMFATCQIPPGVINMLSNKNLFGNDTYIDYEMQEAFPFYTKLKQIVHSLK